MSLLENDLIWGVLAWVPFFALLLSGCFIGGGDMVEDHKDMQHYADLKIRDQRKHAAITGFERGLYSRKELLSAITDTFSEPWADAVQKDADWFTRFKGLQDSMPTNRCAYCGTRHTMKQTICQNCGGPT